MSNSVIAAFQSAKKPECDISNKFLWKFDYFTVKNLKKTRQLLCRNQTWYDGITQCYGSILRDGVEHSQQKNFYVYGSHISWTIGETGLELNVHKINNYELYVLHPLTNLPYV